MKNFKPITNTFDGVQYNGSAIGAIKGMGIAKRLAQLVVPSAASGAVDYNDIGNEGGFTRTAMMITEQMDKVGIEELIMDIFNHSNLYRDNKQLDFDVDYSGNYGEMVEVLAWLLKENFASTLKQLAGMKAHFGNLLPKTEDTTKEE